MKNFKPLLSEEERTRLQEEKSQYRHQCSCGTITYILPFEKKIKKICRSCGKAVYATPQDEFRDKLRIANLKLTRG